MHTRYRGRIDGLDVHEVVMDCWRCQDTGWQPLVAPWMFEPIKSGEWRDGDYVVRVCALCDCKAAEKQASHWPKKSTRKGAAIPIAGDELWHICTNDPEWVRKVRDYEHRPGYCPEFA
jgi:hypothetical protein